MIKKYLKNRSAATAIEYGLIAAGIGLAIMLGTFAFGDALYDNMYLTIAQMMGDAADKAAAE